MYRCCIFDLDGTLVNSIYALTRTVNLTLEQFGLGPIDDAHTRVFVGDGYQKLLERALSYCGDSKLEHLKEAMDSYNELFKANCLYRLEAYDGIRELLAYLKEHQIKAAVLSNKAHERTLDNVEAVFGLDSFDLVFGEKPGVNRKPDPEGVFLIMKTLGVRPEECLYLGDTNTDMKTGQAAGVDTVGVTWGFRDRSELEAYHPKYLAGTPKEVQEILDRNC